MIIRVARPPLANPTSAREEICAGPDAELLHKADAILDWAEDKGDDYVTSIMFARKDNATVGLFMGERGPQEAQRR